MDRLHLEPGQPESGPDPVYIARQLAGILADYHELQARTYRLMQLACTTSAVAITAPAPAAPVAAAAEPVPVSNTGEVAERLQQLLQTLDATPAAVAAASAAAAPVPPARPATPPIVPPRPADLPVPHPPQPAPPVKAVADEVIPPAAPGASLPELLPCQEGARNIVVVSTPALPPSTQLARILHLWTTTLHGPREISRLLGIPAGSVSARLSMEKAKGNERVLLGYRNREQAPPPAPAAKPPPVPKPSQPHVETPAASRQTLQDAPPGPAAPPNPAQIRAHAQMRNRVLEHYAATGDHPNVIARKLGSTLREVEDFIEDAGKADERVRLGHIRRAKQQRAGR